VLVYIGRIDFLQANHQTATIRVVPHISPFQMDVPYQFFTTAEFPTIPAIGKKLYFGTTDTSF
jgi:hypothetical protein